MVNTVKMSAGALRAILGESFDYDEFEKGRNDTRVLFKKFPEVKAKKLEEIKQVLENGDFRHRPGPSYWIGCLSEIDWTR